MKDLCVRCGKETQYDINYPVVLRNYYVEGSGQLCEECFTFLYDRQPVNISSELEHSD